ncbi:MAG: PLP-dependent lyase/thiolase [Candidatus Dojkabacteria bacterium]|nr:PLP-dependent lyase/thiolase [Candidatus Dojkabacteria bacterium]
MSSIWENKIFRNLYPNVTFFSLSEGNTPVEEYDFDGINIYLKREDKNPTNSWKDRAVAFKLSLLANRQVKNVILPTSGNAGISYLKYSKIFYPTLKLVIVLSEHINPQKLQEIKQLTTNTHHEVVITNFTQKVIKDFVKQGYLNLKFSIDNEITKAYWTLGFELCKILNKNKDNTKIAIFCPVSSGTGLVGMMEGIHYLLDSEHNLPRLIAIQTSSNHPLLNNVFAKNLKEEKSLADAIYDPICLRRYQIQKILNQTNGEVLIVSNKDLLAAKNFIKDILKINEQISYNSLLSVAGMLKMINYRKRFRDNILILSGR